MKRILAALVCICTLLMCGCESEIRQSDESRLRGMWICYFELDFADKSRQCFTKSIDKMLDEISQAGYNAVFVHTRAFADAFYSSKLFPLSKYISDNGTLDYDPLPIMIESAHRHGLAFHAWVNPFRVSADSRGMTDEPAATLLKSDKNSVRKAAGGVWLNPASKSAVRLVLDGIRELLQYDIDGIHFDDYFYPTTSSSFDSNEYNDYCKSTEKPLSLPEYRRALISSFVASVHRLITQQKSDVLFGISPQANMSNNYNTLYADIRLWCDEDGFIDYIAPQIYYGFEYKYTTNDGQPMDFLQCFEYWTGIAKNKPLYIGLGLYRSGERVELNGKSNNEWINNSDIILRQIKHIEDKCDGFIVFSYSSQQRNETAKKETENIKNYLVKQSTV